MTKNSKRHRFSAKGEAPTTIGRGGQIWGKWGKSYAEESGVAADLHGNKGVRFSEALIVCVSLTFTLLTQTQTPMIGYTHTKYCLSTNITKRGNVLRLAVSDNSY